MAFSINLSDNTLPKKLDLWEEIVGNLKDFKKQGDLLVLTFTARIDVTTEYSSTFEDKLKKLKGKKIGILATDSTPVKYKVRLIKNEDLYEK